MTGETLSAVAQGQPRSGARAADANSHRELSADQWTAFHRGCEHSRIAARRLLRKFELLHEFDELVSETRVRMVDSLLRSKSPMSFPPTDGQFKGCFLKILYRVAIAEGKRWDPLSEEEFDETRFIPAARVDPAELAEAIANLVGCAANGLPPRRDRVFRLVRFRGMKVADVAAELGISPKTCEHQLHAADDYVRKRIVAMVADDRASRRFRFSIQTEVNRRLDIKVLALARSRAERLAARSRMRQAESSAA